MVSRGAQIDDGRRRARGAARGPLLLSALALLAGCAAVTPLPAEDAVAQYDEVAADLTSVLAGSTGQEWTFVEHLRSVQERDGVCLYSAGAWEAGAPLSAVSAGKGWDEIVAAADPVLEEHGFTAFGRPSRSGALYSVSATDGHGAEVELTAQGTVRIADAEIAAQECTAEGLGL
ncbi:MAG: hypothetical protein L0H74_03130 [Brachybacterium sp.]|nr:hypothetical protein [Brachybacterium sp.]